MKKAFNFKLLVPPRTTLGQVSPVKPQDSGLFEDNSTFLSPVQGYNKCFDKDTSLPFSNTSMVLPTKTPRSEVTKKIAVMPMEKEETSVRCSQLYSKLFEEAEKIKSWKLKVDSEISQKDRKLQDNRRTIETQRKAIQELQFGNERLSLKLEEQLNENEDLRNKNNATRNLCNILKDTFERSTEKISLFEAEREETHTLFMQNHKNIERMVDAFENLRLQAETDQFEMLKVREGLKQFEELKLRFENEYHIKEEEVSILEGKLREKESDFTGILNKLQETQQSYCVLLESAKQDQKLLENSKQAQNKLEEQLKRAEQLRQETEEKQKALANILEETKVKYAKTIQERDCNFEEVSRIKDQLTQCLEEKKIIAESLQCSLSSQKQRAQELESKLISVSEELNKKKAELGKINEELEKRDGKIHLLKNELDTKSNVLKSLEEKIKTDGKQIIHLTSGHEDKQAEINELKEKLKIVSAQNKNMAMTMEQTINGQKQMKEQTLLMEIELKDIQEKLSTAQNNERELSSIIERLQRDVDQHKEKYEDLLEKFHQLQKKVIQQEAENSASETKVLETCLKETEQNEEKLKMEIERLEVEKQQLQMQLEVLNMKMEEQNQESGNFQKQLKESKKNSQNELIKKDKYIKAQEIKLVNLKTKYETKTKALDESLKENKALKKQMAFENVKNEEITKLKEEIHNLEEHHKEETKRMFAELNNKSTSETQLALEVEKFKQTAADAIKSKEDTEIKCQQKISDMVALMEKHKHEYDKMVEEKDAELNEKRMREAEVNANKTSLELELSHLEVENGQMKQQLEIVKKEKETLQQELDELIKVHTLQKNRYMEKKEHLEKEIQALNKQIKSFEKDRTQRMVDRSYGTPDVAPTNMSSSGLSKEAEIEASSKNATATPLKLDDNLLKTPSWTLESKIGATPRIRSFRIRTPPSAEKSAPWRKNTLELDPKSDSSEQNDILSFSAVSANSRKAVCAESRAEHTGLLKKIQNSGVYKSPGAALKLAAIKRMRDAGWTTITSSDKKKKKATDKIFA